MGRNSEAQLWGAEDDRAVYFSLLEPELACLGLAGNQLLVEAVGLLDDLMSGWGGWGVRGEAWAIQWPLVFYMTCSQGGERVE